MASSEDLIPKGLPQGSRQENVAAFRAAGLPVGSQQATPEPVAAVPPAPGAPPVGPTIPARQQMQAFDVFADREPNPTPAPQGRDIIFEQVRQSGNLILQDIFSRMSGYKDG